MKSNYKQLIFASLAIGTLLSACSTGKLASQNNDDVYFSDVTANKLDYATAPQKDYKEGYYNDRNGYDRNDDYYYDNYGYNSRLNYDLNNYSWRDRYYQQNLYSYSPYFNSNSYGFNNGWSIGLGYNNYFNSGWNNNNYGWNNNFNTNSWNYYGSYYGNSPYWGIYSYYQPGYIGSYGNYYGGNGYYGNGYYGNNIINKNLTPRPRGSYDNNDRSSGRTIPIPPIRQPRPDSAYPSNGGRAVDSRGNGTYTPSSRPTRGGSSSDSRDNRPTSQPTSRPTRPTSTPTRSTDNSRTSEPDSRPSRVERPSSPPPSSSNDNSRSSSGSSSGGNSSPRPTRGN